MSTKSLMCTKSSMDPFLAASEFIDFDHPAVSRQARELAAGGTETLALSRRCFEFVRDEIRHSADYRLNPVTCKASDVLLHGTGFCYAKSHLLAALLRFHGIACGLCYQRLTVADDGGGDAHCLHGLNAVKLPEIGWYRVDARGNKAGVCSDFCPPVEALAFAIRTPRERDLPEVWCEPLPSVVAVLQSCRSYDEVLRNLPDIELLDLRAIPCRLP